MSTIIGQNSAGYYPVYCGWKDNIDRTEEIEKVEFIFNKTVFKYYDKFSKSEVLYDTVEHCFLVPLTQEETQTFSYQIPVQIRVKYTTGEIEPSCIQYHNVQNCISQEVM